MRNSGFWFIFVLLGTNLVPTIAKISNNIKQKSSNSATRLVSCKPGCVNGFCVNGTCQCVEGFFGPSCDNAIERSFRNEPGAVGAFCKSLDDCEYIPDTYCEFYSGSCTTGRCICRPGYDTVSGQCVQFQGFGRYCTAVNQICVKNTECSINTGTCLCMAGYKNGPEGECVALPAISKFGEPCSNSDECFYDLVCNNGRCGCSSDRTQLSAASCEPIYYGDQCTTNRDCQRLNNAECVVSGTCQCQVSTSPRIYKTELGEEKLTCSDDTVNLLPGGACPTSMATVCPNNYACIKCPNTTDEPRCLWQGPNVPSSTPSPTPSYIVSKGHSLLAYHHHHHHQALTDTLTMTIRLLFVKLVNYILHSFMW